MDTRRGSIPCRRDVCFIFFGAVEEQVTSKLNGKALDKNREDRGSIPLLVVRRC